MKNFRLAVKLIQKELRQGELSLLFLSIVIAVGSLSCIGFMIKRIDHSMIDHATQLNAAKLILKSTSQVLPEWLSKAKSLSLEQAEMRTFPSMLVINEEFKLAQIKAVSDNFPLQGELLVRETLAAPAKSLKAPPRGQIWLDKRLQMAFNSAIEQAKSQRNGQIIPRIELGESEFISTGILERVPGQSTSFFTIAPTAMINLADLAQTATIQPGSRVDYLYFFSASSRASAEALEEFKQWLKPKLKEGQSLRSGVEELKAVNANLKKAGDFLSLAAVLTVLLASISIAINSHRYGQQQYKNSAIMLCLGCSEKRIIVIELYKLFLLGLLGSLLGIILGYFVFSGVLFLMDDLLPNVGTHSLAAGLNRSPVWVGLCSGILLLLSLSMANLIRLKKLSPMALIRKDLLLENTSSKLFYFFSVAGLLLLSLWYTDNIKVTLLFYVVIALSSLVLYFVSRFLLRGVIKIGRQYHLINRLSLLNIERHKQAVLLQVTTFSLIYALLIIIYLVRTELLDKWQQQFPDETPNHFVINVQSYNTDKFKHYLKQEKIKIRGLYPMVRGRLTFLNHQPIKQVIPENAREHNALNRELGLSISHIMPAPEQSQATLVAGKPWQEAVSESSSVPAKSFLETNGNSGKALPNKIAKISIEQSLAKAMNIKIGDILGFKIGAQNIEGLVYNIREVKWDSFQPNFYIIFSPGLIERYPMTWIASFYLANDDKHKLNALIEQFSGVTIIEVDEILKEIQFIIEKISHTIEFVFFFIIAAGILILSSSLYATLSTRMYENAVIRTLGASAKQLRRCLLIEFSVIALLSALIAIIIAELACFILYQHVFNMSYSVHPWVWLGIFIISLIAISGLGLLVVNKIFTQSTQTSLNQFV